jgi:hypothetical protein
MTPNELVGKRLKQKESLNSPSKLVLSVENGTVYFNDNSRVPLDRVSENFLMDNSPQDYGRPTGDDFFEKSTVSLANSFLQQLQNPQAVNYQPQHQQAYVEDRGITDDYSSLRPDTLNQVQKQLDSAKKAHQKQQYIQENDPWLKNQFSDTGASVSVNADDLAEELNKVKEINETKADVNPQEFYESNKQVDPSAPNKYHSKLPEMKKAKSVKIKLELNEMIPRLEDIKAVENLFADVSIIEEIAKEIVDRYIRDRDVFEGMVIEELEKMVNKKKRTPTRSAPTRSATTRKKPTTSKRKTTSEEKNESNDEA